MTTERVFPGKKSASFTLRMDPILFANYLAIAFMEIEFLLSVFPSNGAEATGRDETEQKNSLFRNRAFPMCYEIEHIMGFLCRS